MRIDGASVLVIEDERLLRRRLRAQLEKLGADVSEAGTLAEGRKLLSSLDFDFALLDVNLPDGRSLEILNERLVADSTAVVVMTAEGGIEGAIEAMRLGAIDYLTKPFDLGEAINRMVAARTKKRRGRRDSFQRQQEFEGDREIFWGAGLRTVRSNLDKIVHADQRLAATGAAPAPVLIEGETGTGKTSLARWLHHHGPRSTAPLVEVNCSALPDALAESELFGHERGAFTDAKEAKMGLIEAADGGALFLDELPSLSSAIQAKLLTAIEDRVVRRVGGRKTISVNVRVIAAAQENLADLVSAGAFRADLRQRLDLFRVRIPPLRERGADIVSLADKLVKSIAKRYGMQPPDIPDLGRERLLAYAWPGNVRELAHEVERALIFENDRLTFSSLIPNPGEVGEISDWLRAGFQFPDDGNFQLERAIDLFVQRALEQSDGNVSAAARLLGVPRDYVRHRLKRNGREKAR